MGLVKKFKSNGKLVATVTEYAGILRLQYPQQNDRGGYHAVVEVLLKRAPGKFLFKDIDGFNEVRETFTGFDFRRIADHDCCFSLTYKQYSNLNLGD